MRIPLAKTIFIVACVFIGINVLSILCCCIKKCKRTPTLIPTP